MSPQRNPYMVLYGHVRGNRKQGRPKRRWIDTIKEDRELLRCHPDDTVQRSRQKVPDTASPGHYVKYPVSQIKCNFIQRIYT